MYGEGKFRITEDDNLELFPEYLKAGEKFDGLITYLGLGVSVGFLFLHLVVFATNPALRNLSDKSLASLCTALLVAYGGYFSFIQLIQKIICHYNLTYTVEIGCNVMKRSEYFVSL